MRDPLFSGPDSLRDSKERRGIILCILTMPLSVFIVGVLLSEALTPSRLLLIGIGALLYVSIARGRLLGDSIHVHEGQMPKLAALVAETARLLDVPVPQVFVRDDVSVPIVAVGVADPYALVISSHWLPHLRDDEMRFLIARELAHIRAGHTRISSILSVNGRENPAVSVMFGAYLRRTEYTADRVGLCCSGSVDAAIKAIAIANFHHLGREVDLSVVADQLSELRSEPTLRAGEWLASSPYAARRIADVVTFASSPLAQRWIGRFQQGPVPMPRPHVEAKGNRVFASWWRRAGAWLIDFGIIASIAPQKTILVRENGAAVALADAIHHMPLLIGAAIMSATIIYLWLYSVVLVAVLGRTVGMMIVDVRVVRADFGRPRIWDAIGRYVLAALTLLTVIPLFLWGLRRVQPYDRLSRTRLVSASAALEPALSTQPKGAIS